MTTSVIVKAHCSNDKIVEVNKANKNGVMEHYEMSDGEEMELVVYDDWVVSVFERMKEKARDPSEWDNLDTYGPSG